MARLWDRIKRNWGWVVTVSAAFLFVVLHGFLYSFGLLMVELMEEFDSDVTITGYVGTVAYGCTWIFCIFATPVVIRFGFRPSAILGVVICAISSLITSFMPGILPIFGSYSLLYSFGNSLLTSSAFLGVMTYSSPQHTTSALGVATAGVNTGILIFNPLLYALISRFGWRNALRLVTAILLSLGLPCTMAFIPMPSSSSSSSSPPHDDDDADLRLRSITSDEKTLSGVCDEKTAALQDRKDTATNQQSLRENHEIGDASHPPVVEATDGKASDMTSFTPDRDAKEHLDLMAMGQISNEEDNLREKSLCGDWLRLLSYPDAWLLGIGILCGSVCLSFLYFSTVNFIILAGFSNWTASLMMATMGLTEIVGKLIIGVVSDRIPVPKLFYMVAGNCFGACVMYATFYAKTEGIMFAIVAVEGCFVMAPLDSLAHSVANQLYEPSLRSTLWSYVMFACGVGGILAAVFGESVDKTGSYDTALYVVIGVFFTAALCLVLVPVYQRAFSKDRYILFKNVKAVRKGKANGDVQATTVYELLPQTKGTNDTHEV